MGHSLKKLSSGQRTGKGQCSFQSQRAVPKNVQIIIQFCSFCMLIRLSSKSFKLGFNNMRTENFQMYRLSLEKAEEQEIKLATSAGSQKKARKFPKNVCFCFIDYERAFVWITTNCEKLLKRWGYQTALPASCEICVQVKKQQLNLDMEQQTCSQLGNEYVKAVYCHPAYLTYMQSTSCEMLGWMNHKLELRFPGEISTASDMQFIPH